MTVREGTNYKALRLVINLTCIIAMVGQLLMAIAIADMPRISGFDIITILVISETVVFGARLMAIMVVDVADSLILEHSKNHK